MTSHFISSEFKINVNCVVSWNINKLPVCRRVWLCLFHRVIIAPPDARLIISFPFVHVFTRETCFISYSSPACVSTVNRQRSRRRRNAITRRASRARSRPRRDLDPRRCCPLTSQLHGEGGDDLSVFQLAPLRDPPFVPVRPHHRLTPQSPAGNTRGRHLTAGPDVARRRFAASILLREKSSFPPFDRDTFDSLRWRIF